MNPLTRHLYSFLGLHSFVIGLFLFYIPVYLFKTGYTIDWICLFIALTGIGFTMGLILWDRATKKVGLKWLIGFSFLSEWLLLSAFFMEKNLLFLICCGLLNGIFNCSFWMIQRFIFFETITPQNSGRKFGNFQIFVLIVLKTGIFIGGVLLEKSGYLSVYILAGFLIFTGSFFFIFKNRTIDLPFSVRKSKPISLSSVIGFHDAYRSRIIFAIDGGFLYLESYFWVISLFIIVRSNYFNLGILVIFLTIVFSLLFILIKNRMDQYHTDTLYRFTAFAYALSWVLRAVLNTVPEGVKTILLLSVITFFTSLFRLAFNKRFFDIAKATTGHGYILLKSYFSQFFLAVIALAGSIFLQDYPPVKALEHTYLFFAPLSLIYLIYRRP